MSSNRVWLLFGAYFFSGLIVSVWSSVALVVVLAAGALHAGLLVARARRTGDRLGMSTQCEKCGAALPSRFGIPERTCRQCGQRQTWAH